MEETAPKIRLDIREQLKFKERLNVLLDESNQVLVIGETEAEKILSCSDGDAVNNLETMLDLELPIKQAGSGSGHQHRKIRDLLLSLR